MVTLFRAITSTRTRTQTHSHTHIRTLAHIHWQIARAVLSDDRQQNWHTHTHTHIQISKHTHARKVTVTKTQTQARPRRDFAWLCCFGCAGKRQLTAQPETGTPTEYAASQQLPARRRWKWTLQQQQQANRSTSLSSLAHEGTSLAADGLDAPKQHGDAKNVTGTRASRHIVMLVPGSQPARASAWKSDSVKRTHHLNVTR